MHKYEICPDFLILNMTTLGGYVSRGDMDWLLMDPAHGILKSLAGKCLLNHPRD